MLNAPTNVGFREQTGHLPMSIYEYTPNDVRLWHIADRGGIIGISALRSKGTFGATISATNLLGFQAKRVSKSVKMLHLGGAVYL
jgi:hypothetical protein